MKETASLVVDLNLPKKIDKDYYEVYIEVTDENTNEVLSTTTQKIFILDDLYIKFSENSTLYLILIVMIIIILILIIILVSVFQRRKYLKIKFSSINRKKTYEI